MIYIQSTSDRNRAHHFDAACAMFGAIELAEDYRLTSFEEVQSGKFDNLIKSHLFVGSVEFMREVFSRVNKIPQPILNSDREHWTMTLDAVRQDIENGETWFVKPFQQKLFSGLVVDKYSISSLREFPNDLEVMVYQVLPKLVTEWRVYVLNNRIEDIRNYGGDFMEFPDVKFIKSKVKQYANELPSAYVMDVGLSIGNSNHIIEFNDMYAIGNYGVPNDLYLRMLRQRYFEIMRS